MATISSNLDHRITFRNLAFIGETNGSASEFA